MCRCQLECFTTDKHPCVELRFNVYFLHRLSYWIQLRILYSSRIEQCDVNIYVADQTFSCNSFLLCACSEFFQVLMHSKSSKSSQEHCDNLVIRGINSDIFALVLDAIFKGENKIGETNVIEVWYAAHHLQINFLIQKCETFIVDHVTVDNYSHFYPHAARLKSDIVLNKIREIMVMNFDDFRKTDIFLRLPVDDLVAMIKGDEIKSHDCVVESCLRWVEFEEVSNCDGTTNEDNIIMKSPTVRDDGRIEVFFDDKNLKSAREFIPLNRQDYIGRLISSARMDLVSKEGLKMLLDNDLVMDNREARDIVRKALSAQLEPGRAAKTCDDASTIKSTVATSSFYTETNSTANIDSLNVDAIHNANHMFIFLDIERKLKAYNILTNQFFLMKYLDIGGCDMSYQKISINNNHTLYFLLSSSPDKSGRSIFRFVHVSNSVKIIWQLRVGAFFAKGAPLCTANGTFVYTFCPGESTLEILRTKVKSDSSNLGIMTNFGKFNIQGTLNSVFNFKDKIIAIYSSTKDEQMNIYAFNTETRILDYVAQLSGKEDRIITFSFGDRLFILQGNGNLTELTEKNESVLAEYHPPLWDLSLTIYGAMVISGTLYIATDMRKTISLPSSCQFGSMKFVNFVQNVSCQYATLDQMWLGEEI
ncbi:hypothetical protein Btru_056350 [Bulinus truncatus]|nr:hypothetical protein Btru_056350 [Bulinus truncatus]